MLPKAQETNKQKIKLIFTKLKTELPYDSTSSPRTYTSNRIENIHPHKNAYMSVHNQKVKKTQMPFFDHV